MSPQDIILLREAAAVTASKYGVTVRIAPSGAITITPMKTESGTAAPKRSSAAERQKRYRERKRNLNQ